MFSVNVIWLKTTHNIMQNSWAEASIMERGAHTGYHPDYTYHKSDLYMLV